MALTWTAQAELLQLTGVSGETGSGENIGPYFVTVDGVSQMVVCDDLFIQINMGQTWNANRLTWADLPNQDRPMYGTAYWLVDNILDKPGPHADSQWALWHLFSPQSDLPGGSSTELAWAGSQYTSQPDYTGYAELVIYRPVPRESSQEMLGLTETPEPTTFAYMGIGLALLIVSRFRRQVR